MAFEYNRIWKAQVKKNACMYSAMCFQIIVKKNFYDFFY